MLIGRLDKKITIQKLVAGSPQQTGSGAPDVAWADLISVWASIEPVKGRELFAGQAFESEVTVRFRIRYRSDVTAGMRIVCDGKYYNITAVPPDTRHVRKAGLELMCTQGLNDG
jgi:SPP1 family predicted phage head-tail adaptor